MEDQVTNPENQEVSGDNKTNMYDVMFGSATTNPEQSSTEQPQEEEEVILPEQLQEAEEDYDEVEEVEEIVEEEEIQETPQSYTVKVDGEEYEVDLDDLEMAINGSQTIPRSLNLLQKCEKHTKLTYNLFKQSVGNTKKSWQIWKTIKILNFKSFKN